ncbi:TniB family NTP-binding protein [Sphingomonas sp. MMS24-JH45]
MGRHPALDLRSEPQSQGGVHRSRQHPHHWGQGRVPDGRPQFGTQLCGKSASADEFALIVAARGTYPVGTLPVVRVELEQESRASGSGRRSWSTDGLPPRGTRTRCRRSAYDAFEKHGTHLLIIDEVQHAGYRSAGSSAPTDVIKRFISDKQVALGLFGNEDAEKLLSSNDQLCTRLEDPCDIQLLNLADPPAQRVFTKFVRKYEDQLVLKKVFAAPSNLTDERTILCLMAISRGYLGRVVKLIQVAARHAYRRGADRIEPFDLSRATIGWAVKQDDLV